MQKNTKPALRITLYVALITIGLIISYIALGFAALSLCGVSGCSGGGFGVISNPNYAAVVFSFAVSSVAAASGPLTIIALSNNKKRWIKITITTFIIAALLGTLLVQR